ncbi:hypothetical protein [Candidatus Methylobacter oryzae]|uniref:Uncharacterized protein n=1 Tax=Candidatus Methylobacter oryzae TaxID=2497749 RepID=A0ABY3CAR0_9GAMM|nr:hypothetical protein [Candidatus Methylobacter oryzae]TRW94226.1 hypothetical protein EKO24_012310 [Candidatus Methylobacter oryzae]
MKLPQNLMQLHQQIGKEKVRQEVKNSLKGLTESKATGYISCLRLPLEKTKAFSVRTAEPPSLRSLSLHRHCPDIGADKKRSHRPV